MNGANLALRVRGLTKIYQLYNQPIDRLKELLSRRQRHRDFVALQEVSFELPHGRTLGIVGDNGAGKSTLLQLIAGTLTPTSGNIERKGSVLGLLELGGGSMWNSPAGRTFFCTETCWACRAGRFRVESTKLLLSPSWRPLSISHLRPIPPGCGCGWRFR